MCPDNDTLVSFLYDEYDGSEQYDRQELERHLDECESCAAEVAAFGGVRQQLREWNAPEKMPLGFRVVREPVPKTRWWTAGRSVPFPLAAAAALVLGAALGMARLDVQYDAQGFRVRTGWGHDGVTASSEALAGRASGEATTAATTGAGAAAAFIAGEGGGRGAGVGPAVGRGAAGGGVAGPQMVSTGGFGAGPAIGGGAGAAAAPLAAGATPWRAEIVALERQMRQEMAALRQSELARAGSQVQAASVLGDPSSGGGRTMADSSTIQRIQQMIDQSEVRQQQNLALRVAELSREFDVQRRTDLVRIEQGFGRLNDQRELDAQQQRQLLNAIRVSQQRPQ